MVARPRSTPSSNHGRHAVASSDRQHGREAHRRGRRERHDRPGELGERDEEAAEERGERDRGIARDERLACLGARPGREHDVQRVEAGDGETGHERRHRDAEPARDPHGDDRSAIAITTKSARRKTRKNPRRSRSANAGPGGAGDISPSCIRRRPCRVSPRGPVAWNGGCGSPRPCHRGSRDHSHVWDGALLPLPVYATRWTCLCAGARFFAAFCPWCFLPSTRVRRAFIREEPPVAEAALDKCAAAARRRAGREGGGARGECGASPRRPLDDTVRCGSAPATEWPARRR